ncbi:MAG: cell envelope protein SmpA [Pseudomonas sp.]|uniref:cell envelope protein SmpA n=1 Tax=Pseudomonas sp. TaxID=306 RepID=UPI0023A64C17|nr:cell envelope protein SmpA [Pseudomonas sp.]MDE1197380.1 cell envelope protein SmpA [Pseudomonas sp.]
MLLDIRKSVIAALLFLPLLAWGTTVHRCEDPTGNITFTTLSCPPGHELKLQEAHNAPPGMLAPASTPAKEAANVTKNRELVVVGQRDDGCGNVLSPENRRRAIINEQTPTGMTKRDVESLLGKPDRIVERNGEMRYVYTEKKGRSRQVTFDEYGCVKGKREKRKP